MKKKYLVLIIILIFIISIAIRYWPILHKNYSPGFAIENLILARNLSLTGEYSIDNEKNVILSSKLINEQGIKSSFGNKLTPVLYSKVFDLFGFNQSFPLYVSLVLYGVISILLFLLIFKLFNIWIALLFSFVEILSPLVLQEAIKFGIHEWAMLFLTIALLIYLWKEKPGLIKLILSAIFFVLAFLSRNSFLIIPVVFLIYDFWKNKSIKRTIVFLLPILILGVMFLGIDSNTYLNTQDKSNVYLHIFPDSYTWHFERDAYVEKIKGADFYNYDFSQFLLKYGYPVSLKNKILMYWASIKSYPKGLFAQTTIGGPFLVFFLILGGFYLYRKKKYLLKLFILWAGFLYIFLIIAKSNHWGHFSSLQFPIFLLISLGIYSIINYTIKKDFKFKYILIFGIIFTLFFHLIQSDKWMLHQKYLYSKIAQSMEMVEIVKENNLDKTKDIIAAGGENSQVSMLINYYTDISSVYFHPETIKKLLKEEKLQWAFDQFEVTKVVGFDKELNKEIIKTINIDILD